MKDIREFLLESCGGDHGYIGWSLSDFRKSGNDARNAIKNRQSIIKKFEAGDINMVNVDCGAYGELKFYIDHKENNVTVGYSDKLKKKLGWENEMFKMSFGPNKEAYTRILNIILDVNEKLK